jgi:hypothetical protein
MNHVFAMPELPTMEQRHDAYLCLAVKDNW